MLKKLLRNLRSNFNELYKKEKDRIVDIILFGSAVKGESYRDIDVCIITRERIDTSKFKFPKNLHLTMLDISTIFDPRESLWRTLIHEGISVLNGRRVSEYFGFVPKTLFYYNLKNLNKNDKVKFVYALRGRDKKGGVLKSVNGTYISRNVVVVPVEKENEFEEFLISWKVDFEKRRIFVEV